ncbi:MAG: hypothetical protein ACOCVG_04660 [Verrucomicrobiota bacterium]
MPASPALLESHRALVDEVHEVLLQENRVLKDGGDLVEQGIVERKNALLDRLNKDVDALQHLANEETPRDETSREIIAALQNKLMKIFFLDRENEQLLLKASVGSVMIGQHRAQRVGRAYGK